MVNVRSVSCKHNSVTTLKNEHPNKAQKRPLSAGCVHRPKISGPNRNAIDLLKEGISASPKLVHKEGYLYKPSSNVSVKFAREKVKKFSRRWFVLDGHRLTMFKTEEDKRLLLDINLLGSSVCEINDTSLHDVVVSATKEKLVDGRFLSPDSVEKKYVFLLTTTSPENSQREFILAALSDSERASWVSALGQACHAYRLFLDESFKSIPNRIPRWAGTPLQEGEFEIGIAAAPQDEAYARAIAKLVADSGMSVTTDVAHLHRTRAYVLVYSDHTCRHETTLRTLTGAAERFNFVQTIIVPVVHPTCTDDVIDRIPDNLAYSLCNTTFYNLRYLVEPVSVACGELTTHLSNYVHSKATVDITGVWHFRASLTGECGVDSYSVKEFTMFLFHETNPTRPGGISDGNGDRIFGITVNGAKVSGTLSDQTVRLSFSYSGPWRQIDEGWERDALTMEGEIHAKLLQVGRRMEGSYVDATGTGGARYGAVSGTLEQIGLTGYYRVKIKLPDDLDSEDSAGLVVEDGQLFGVVHRGGGTIAVDVPGGFGQLVHGVFDSVAHRIYFAAELGNAAGFTFTGTLHRCAAPASGRATPAEEVDFGARIQAVLYSHVFEDNNIGCIPMELEMLSGSELMDILEEMSGELVTPPPSSLVCVDPALLKLLAAPHEGVCEGASGGGQECGGEHNILGKHPLSARVANSHRDRACVILYTTSERRLALRLRSGLAEKGIAKVSVDRADALSAKSAVILLSKNTREDTGLISLIAQLASAEVPLFNVGVASWFEIFGDPAWNPEMKGVLMAALARLNMTDETTLSPRHPNFLALAKGIRAASHPPKFYLHGMWLFEFAVVGPDGSRMKMIWIDHTPGHSHLKAHDLDGNSWEGQVDGTAVHFEDDDVLYEAEVHRKGRVLLGRRQWKGGWRSVAFSATLETDGVSGLFTEDPSLCPGMAKSTRMITQTRQFGLVQRGGTRILAYYDGAWGHGVTFDSRIRIVLKGLTSFASKRGRQDGSQVHHFRPDETTHVQAGVKNGEGAGCGFDVMSTVCGQVYRSSDSVRIVGFVYDSRQDSVLRDFAAQKVSGASMVSQAASQSAGSSAAVCPDAQVQAAVERIWDAWNNARYRDYISEFDDATKEQFPLKAFLRHRQASVEMIGKCRHIRYIGRRALRGAVDDDEPLVLSSSDSNSSCDESTEDSESETDEESESTSESDGDSITEANASPRPTSEEESSTPRTVTTDDGANSCESQDDISSTVDDLDSDGETQSSSGIESSTDDSNSSDSSENSSSDTVSSSVPSSPRARKKRVTLPKEETKTTVKSSVRRLASSGTSTSDGGGRTQADTPRRKVSDRLALRRRVGRNTAGEVSPRQSSSRKKQDIGFSSNGRSPTEKNTDASGAPASSLASKKIPVTTPQSQSITTQQSPNSLHSTPTRKRSTVSPRRSRATLLGRSGSQRNVQEKVHGAQESESQASLSPASRPRSAQRKAAINHVVGSRVMYQFDCDFDERDNVRYVFIFEHLFNESALRTLRRRRLCPRAAARVRAPVVKTKESSIGKASTDDEPSTDKDGDDKFAKPVGVRCVKHVSLEEEAASLHRSVYDVMISYRSKDGRFVDLLQAFLEKNQFLCWRDRRMEVGANWSEDITQAVRRSGCVVACISDEYVASPLCTNEVLMASDYGKTVLPLFLPSTQPKKDGFPLVSKSYSSSHPPHVIAKEISSVSWFDLRPFSGGPDPSSIVQFEKKYERPLRCLVTALRNLRRQEVIWNISGLWVVNLQPMAGELSMDPIQLRLGLVQKEGMLSGHAYLKDRNLTLEVEPESVISGSRVELNLSGWEESESGDSSSDNSSSSSSNSSESDEDGCAKAHSKRVTAHSDQNSGGGSSSSSSSSDSSGTLWRVVVRAVVSMDGMRMTGLFFERDGEKGAMWATRGSQMEIPESRKRCPDISTHKGVAIESMVDSYFNFMLAGNYDAWADLFQDECVETEVEFQDEGQELQAEYGDYGYCSFVGYREDYVDDDGNTVIRYEFDCWFTKSTTTPLRYFFSLRAVLDEGSDSDDEVGFPALPGVGRLRKNVFPDDSEEEDDNVTYEIVDVGIVD
eukprot:Rmarinus@m.12452